MFSITVIVRFSCGVQNTCARVGCDIVEQALHRQDLSAKGSVCRRAGHDDNECVLFLIEWVLEWKSIRY